MEHALRELLMGLLRKVWPHRPDPRWPIAEVLLEKRRLGRLYAVQTLLFFVNWGLVTWVLGKMLRWIYYQTLSLPPETLAYLPMEDWQFYALAFTFGLALAGPLSSACVRLMTDYITWQKFLQFSEWKAGIDNRAGYVVAGIVLFFAFVILFLVWATPFLLTRDSVSIRGKWLPGMREYPLSDIRSIDHYVGYLNRAGDLRRGEYFEFVMADGLAIEFMRVENISGEEMQVRKMHILDTLKELTGLEIREMGVATPFQD